MSKMTAEQYKKYVEHISPKSPTALNMVKAFIGGGLICLIGQGILELWTALMTDPELAASAASVSMIFLGILLTGLGLYDEIAKFGKAGTLVPITGFANSVASPAMEFKSEGYVSGMAAKMFVIAGPVIVYGLSTSVIYGILYFIFS